MTILQKPAWGDAIAYPTYGLTGAVGGMSGITSCGAVGATGSTGNSGFTCVVGATGPLNTGRISGLPYTDELPSSLCDVTKVIRCHRRVYRHEPIGDEALLNFMRNRLLVRTVAYYSRNESDTIVGRYVDWLDDHNSGLYLIDETSQCELVVSFEMESDMVQFAIALR